MKLAVGIDIGGTITKIGLVSEDGKCIKKTSFRTKEINNFSDYIQELCNCIESITDDTNSICGIGIGAPNASKNGTIETPANLKWKGKLNLVEELKNKVNTKIFLSLSCLTISALTFAPLICGDPTENCSLSQAKRTSSIVILSPSLPSILLTLNIVFSLTLYCFPPVEIIANIIEITI